MKNNLLALCVFVSLSIGAFTQTTNNPIPTAVPSLSIAPDARAGGMGDIGAATTPDVNSQYWNAAKYVFMESDAGLLVSYTPWLRKLVSDINLAYVAGYYKLDPRQAVSASLRYFSLGDITLMDQLGIPQGSAHPNELAVDVAYSRLLSDKLSAAATMRFIYSDLNNGINLAGGTPMYPGAAVSVDISAYYKTPLTVQNVDGQMAFGVNISNIGSKISYDQNETSNFIPTNLRLGGSYDYPLDNYNKISISTDLNKLLVPTPKLNPTAADITAYNNLSPIAGIFESFTDAPGV